MPLTLSGALAWQYWVSFLRLIAGSCGIGYCTWMAEHYPHPNDPFDIYMLVSLLLWIWVAVNDLFILTVDFKRTKTYLGCIATQAASNFTFVVLIVSCIVLELTRFGLYSYIHSRGHPRAVMLGVAIPLAGICSLCLLSISLWPVFALRSELSIGDILKTNTKDAFIMTPTPVVYYLNTLGSPRSIPAPLPSPRRIYAVFHSFWVRIPGPSRWPGLVYLFSRRVGRGTVGFFTRLFLRRVNPVESRMYALSRNTFAVACICILVFRTATALQQAQNKVGTRTTSANCEGRASPVHTLGVLMEHRYSKYVSTDIATFRNRAWDQPVTDLSNSEADVQSCVRAYLVPPQLGPANQTLELWTCSTPPKLIPQPGSYNLKPDPYVDGIYITVKNLMLDRELTVDEMPLVWLFNLKEHPADRNLSSIDDVRLYLPPWRLRRGFHIEAEAKLITRRFITSSIMKDIVLGAEPSFRPLSLYPIVDSSIDALNNTVQSWATRFTHATATIHTSLSPGLMYLRSQTEEQPPNAMVRAEACDFIEDYRSGSVLDVIGSVGGLFALLHAAHVLLFGRPLLWGLTGSKLIHPFGLLGACSSKGFKRRLKDRYHRHSTDDGSDSIRVGAFLRDFVIDFGPADIDMEHQPTQRFATTSTLVANDKNTPEVEVPLIRMQSDETIPEKDDDINPEQDTGRNPNQTHSMV